MDLKLGLLLIISTQMSASLVLAQHLVCPAHYLPVCGSDGKTYSNPCMLNSTAQMSGKRVTLIRYGRCGEPAQDDCVCPDNYKPVCGTDGQTYPNECSLECQKKRFDPILRVMDYYGPCQPPQPPACGCSQETSPVCASDGNTYRNNCILKCIARDNFMLTFVHAGPC